MITFPPFVLNIRNETVREDDSYEDFDGLELKILNVIAQATNLKMYYYFDAAPMNWGAIHPNGTLSGNTRSLFEAQHDIALGSFAATLERFFLFKTSIIVSQTIHWCVPNALIDDKLHAIAEMVDLGASLVTLASYLLITASVWLLNKHWREGDTYPSQWRHHREALYANPSTIPFYTYSIVLGLGVHKLPLKNLNRILVAALVIYSMYFGIAYQTLLTSVLSNAEQVQKYQTLDDILQADLDILLLPGLRRYFGEDTQKEVSDRWQLCSNSSACLDRVAYDKDAAICMPKLFADYVVSNFYVDQQTRTPLVVCFDNAIVTFPINIMMRKDFPLYEVFEELVKLMNAAGLLSKWQHDIGYKNLRMEIDSLGGGDENRTALSLESLRYIFFVLLIGCGCSCVVFLVELLWSKERTVQ